MKLLEVRKLIIKSKNLKELESNLKKEGLSFKSRNELRKFVVDSWRESYEKYLERKILNKPIPKKLDGLPYKLVQLNGTKFYIHGVVHGESKSFECSSRVKKFVRKCANSYINPPHEDYLCEYNFSLAAAFSLDPKREVEDIIKITTNTGLAKAWVVYILQFVFFLLLRPIIELLKFYPFLKFSLKSLQDERYLPIFQEIQNKGFLLPEPLGMQLAPYRRISDKLVVRRSRKMAKTLYKHAKKNKLKRLHGIMGQGHVRQVVYFLEQMKK